MARRVGADALATIVVQLKGNAMTPDELRAAPEPPGQNAAIDALWWVAHGDWTRAHKAAASDEGRSASWVHAHLHRVEGDTENAGYWYSQAGQPIATMPVDEEWKAIAVALLG